MLRNIDIFPKERRSINAMRIVFTCDLHGRSSLYEQMFDYAVQEAADCIVIGGDLFPTWLKSPYKLLTGGIDFTRAVQFQLSFIDTFLAPEINAFCRRHPGIRILYVPGNHDWEKSLDYFRESTKEAALCLHLKSEKVGRITFTGYGCVTDSSFWVKDYVRRDLRESGYTKSRYPFVSTKEGIMISPGGSYALDRPSIDEELDSLDVCDPEKTVSIFHCPPYGTGLDTLYTGKPIGSRAIEFFIRKQRPLVSLHGHIHEAPYMSGFFHTSIGPTLSINPGHNPKDLHAVCFDSDDPSASLKHRIFGTYMPRSSEFNRAKDRYARAIKGLLMKKVLMK